MNRTKRAYWILGASLLALLAVCVYVFFLSNSGDDRGRGQDSTQLDEMGQSPRIQSLPKQTENGKAEASDAPESSSQSEDAAETESAQATDTETGIGDPDEEAREYDKNGQVGDPPSGWKDDYSHWDSGIWQDSTQSVEQIGLIQKNMDAIGYSYQPTEEQAQRMEELDQEAEAAAEKGLISQDPKGGYVRLDFALGFGEEDGTDSQTIYAAPDFADRFREIWDERVAINKAGMVPVANSYDGTQGLGWNGSSIGTTFEILYLRRPSDGSLVRAVRLPNGERKQFVAAPPPSNSQFSQGEIEMMQKGWERFWKKQMGEN